MVIKKRKSLLSRLHLPRCLSLSLSALLDLGSFQPLTRNHRFERSSLRSGGGARPARRKLSACCGCSSVTVLVSGLGSGVWGLGFGIWGLGSGVWGLGFRGWCRLPAPHEKMPGLDPTVWSREMSSGSEEGSYLRLIDLCITQL